MLTLHDPDHFLEVVKFAISVGALDKFQERIDYLNTYADGYCNCHLAKDSAPNSFDFVMFKDDGTRWFNGGLIYSGPGQPMDGSAPAFTVSLTQSKGHSWGVHT